MSSWKEWLSETGRIRRFWNRAHSRPAPATWLDDPHVRLLVNERISGSVGRWPMDWFQDLGLPRFDRAVSLGCGTGALERDLARRGLVRCVLGIDLSPSALARARGEARSAGLEGVAYAAADLNRLRLAAGSLDAVFVHQALHHVAALESCVDEVAAALHPDGVLFLDEYVGPSRSEWNREKLRSVREVFERIPSAARRVRRLRLPVDREDPSEAVRSSEIESVVAQRFRCVERRAYGGNLFAPLMPTLQLERLGAAEHKRWIETLDGIEKEWLERGVASFYVLSVNVKRP
jgi:SAM-dependent methyltransferase